MAELKNLHKFSTTDFPNVIGPAKCSECSEKKRHCYQHRVDKQWILCFDCYSAYVRELSEKPKRPYGPKSGGQVQSNRRKY